MQTVIGIPAYGRPVSPQFFKDILMPRIIAFVRLCFLLINGSPGQILYFLPLIEIQSYIKWVLPADCPNAVCISTFSCLLGFEEKGRKREWQDKEPVAAEFVSKAKLWYRNQNFDTQELLIFVHGQWFGIALLNIYVFSFPLLVIHRVPWVHNSG